MQAGYYGYHLTGKPIALLATCLVNNGDELLRCYKQHAKE